MIEILLTDEQRAALGSIVAESASLESHLNLMITGLTGLSEAQFSILVGGQMLGRKLDIVKELALLKLKSEKGRKTLTELMERINALNQDRNTVVHGTWGDQEGMVRLGWIFARAPSEDVYAVLKKGKGAKLRTVSATRLNELSKNLSDANSELFAFFMENFMRQKIKRRVRKLNIKAA